MERYRMQQLRELMARLRDPQTGCPWDLEQDLRSLVPHTLEEVYELADAIERGDAAQLRDELGDYLFQAVFYAQIAAERGVFDFDDVTHGIVAKLLRRHPHVFPDGTLQSARAPGEPPDSARIHARWESIKQDDRRERDQHGVLDDVPLALPALQRAGKLQRRAAGVGFDWPQLDGVMAKLHEEIAELAEAAAREDAAACEEEMGDLLFSCVNLARHLGVDPETALRRANTKFERRFRALEEALAARGRHPADCDLATLDAEWDAAKARLGPR
jgi:ATP diphosphatase